MRENERRCHTAAMDLLYRRLVFVTGKGGIGKTKVADAIGIAAARRGKRGLIAETVGGFIASRVYPEYPAMPTAIRSDPPEGISWTLTKKSSVNDNEFRRFGESDAAAIQGLSAER